MRLVNNCFITRLNRVLLFRDSSYESARVSVRWSRGRTGMLLIQVSLYIKFLLYCEYCNRATETEHSNIPNLTQQLTSSSSE
jgi:hypothetical protein